MELYGGREAFLITVSVLLVTRCTGQDICNANFQSFSGSVMTASFPEMVEQSRCQCIIRNDNSVTVSIDMTIEFDVSDYNDPCNQRFVMEKGNSMLSVCPSDTYKVHKTIRHLYAGESYTLHTLGTDSKLWILKYNYSATSSVSISCSASTNSSATPPCPCAGSYIAGPIEGKRGSDDLGRRLGIGFGVVLGILALLAIALLVWFFLKKRRRGEQATKMGSSYASRPQQPPQVKERLDQENNPVIMDPMKVAPNNYPIYSDIEGQPVNTNMAYTPDEHKQHPGSYPNKSSDSGLNSMQNSRENVNGPPPSYTQQPYYNQPYNQPYIPPQPVSTAPDPSALYARPRRNGQPNRRSLTGQGATGSQDMLYPLGQGYEDNELYVTDTSGSHNNSQNYVQTEV